MATRLCLKGKHANSNSIVKVLQNTGNCLKLLSVELIVLLHLSRRNNESVLRQRLPGELFLLIRLGAKLVCAFLVLCRF